jgi:hypothetical protein
MDRQTVELFLDRLPSDGTPEALRRPLRLLPQTNRLDLLQTFFTLVLTGSCSSAPRTVRCSLNRCLSEADRRSRDPVHRFAKLRSASQYAPTLR